MSSVEHLNGWVSDWGTPVTSDLLPGQRGLPSAVLLRVGVPQNQAAVTQGLVPS